MRGECPVNREEKHKGIQYNELTSYDEQTRLHSTADGVVSQPAIDKEK